MCAQQRGRDDNASGLVVELGNLKEKTLEVSSIYDFRVTIEEIEKLEIGLFE